MSTSPTSAESTRSQWSHATRELIAAWGPKALYAAKTSAAAIASLWIAYRLNLPQPYAAPLSVFVVSQPVVGKVLEKSLYRFLGALAGVVAALVILGLFAQQRVLFIGTMALWTGLCTVGASASTGATFFRSFRGYAFILAGFAAVFVGFGAQADPGEALQLGIGFGSDVALGVLCAGIISLVLFPQHLSAPLVSMARNNASQLYRTIADALRHRLSAEESERHQRQFMVSTFQFESSRGGAVFEDPVLLARSARLQRLNAHFMAITSTLNVIERKSRRTDHDNAVAVALRPLTEELIATILPGGTPPQNAVEAEWLLPRLRTLLAGWPQRVAAQRRRLIAAHHDHFDDTAQLLRQLVSETLSYTDTYAALHRPREVQPRPRAPYRPAMDPWLLILNGIRAAGALVLLSVFWIATAWPNAFLAIVFASFFSTFVCTFPDPLQVLPALLKGYVLGLAAATACGLWLIPRVSGFAMLSACLLPFIVPALVAQTQRKYYGLATVYLAMFTLSLSVLSGVNGPMQSTASALFNTDIGLMLGIGATVLAFSALIPDRRLRGPARHIARQRAALVRLCHEPLRGLRHWFESTTRDRLQAQMPPAGPQSIAAALATLELGHGILNLRRTLAVAGLPEPARADGDRVLADMRRWLMVPDSAARVRTVHRLRHVQAALTPPPGVAENAVVRRVRLAVQRLQRVLADEAAIAPLMSPTEHADAA